MIKTDWKKIFINTIIYLSLFIGLSLVIKLINVSGFIIGHILYKHIYFLDINNVYIINVIHHLYQGIIVLGIIILITKISQLPFDRFYIVKKLPIKSVKTIFIFIAIWTVIQFIFELIYIYIWKLPFPSPYPISAEYVIPDLLFQLFFTGPSEELVFRSLAFSVLLMFLSSAIKRKNIATILAIVSSDLIFMFDHINFSLNPFQVLYFNPYQMLTCSIFGTFYALLLLKYKSVIPAMIAHSLLNVSITLLTVLQFSLTYFLH